MRCCIICGANYRTDFERCPLDGGTVTFAASDPLIGKTLGGHCVIEALIGVGAMGRVYRAHHTRLLNKRYAVKVLFGELTASAEMRMRFAGEAESASKLEHPNIVDVLDFGCSDAGLLYLVMDLVEGPTLGQLIEQGAMSPDRVLRYARQMCAGLEHAHARGIVHRDFKPDNILVSGEAGDEALRIADFGLAISIADGADARLTATGVMCTPAYAAPEQLLGHDVDHRADLYALGVTLYEMLTGGILPFTKGSHEVMLWKVTTEWPAVSTQAPRVPAPLARVVRQLLAREPADRPASARDVMHAFDRLTGEGALSTATRVREWKRWIAGAGVALAGIIVTIAMLAVGGPNLTSASVPINDVVASEETTQAKLAPTVAHETIVPEPPAEESVETTPQRRIQTVVVRGDKGRHVSEMRFVDAPPAPVVADKPVEPVAPMEPVKIEEPPPTAAPVPPPKPIIAPPPPAPAVAPRVVARPPRIVELDVAGGLPDSVVRRALERVLPALQSCAAQVGTRVVTVRFAIEETRRATAVKIGGAGGACVAAELANVRTEAAPDVGDVSVEVRLAFGSGS